MAKLIKSLILCLFAAGIFFAVQGQASSAAAQPPRRGEGVGLISGYQVRGLRYRLGGDPALIDALEFELDGPAGQAQVSLDAAPGRSFPCRNTSGFHWECPLEGVGTGEASQVWVSASG